MKKIIVTTFSFFLLGVVFAQPLDTARFRLDFTPKLQNFQKITQPATIPETTPEPVDFEYEIVPQSVELSFAPTPIKPVKLPGEVMKKLYRNFLKVGFGYPLTPLGELCIHNFDNTKFSYGINANHISGWAPPIGKEMNQYAYAPFSDTRAKLFFNTFFQNQTLYSSIGYNHEVAHLYGFKDPDPYVHSKEFRKYLRNNFHHAYAEVGFRSNFLQEDPKLKQDVRINYDFLYRNENEFIPSSEHHIGLASFFAYDVLFNKLNGFLRPQLDFNVDYYLNLAKDKNNEDLFYRENGFMIEFTPTVKFAVREYHIRVGLGIPVINNDFYVYAQCPVYPIAEVQLGIVPGILSIYGGVDGNVKYNALKDMLYENPFLGNFWQNFRFTKTQLSVFGGIKGNLIKKMNYHISARFSPNVKDMPFFILTTNSTFNNSFGVEFYDGDILNVCANLNWQVVDRLYLNLEGNYWGYYNLKYWGYYDIPVKKLWYKPNWEVAFSGKYYLKEKFIFDLNMKLGFSAWALVPNREGSIYTPEEMKPILDFGAGFEYLVTKRFSCFAMLNNIGFQHYAKYYDYKNVGFNAVVGITYSFGDESLRRGKR